MGEHGTVIAAAMKSLELATGPEFPCTAEYVFFFVQCDSVFSAEHVQSLHLPHYACLFLLERVKMKKLVFREALIGVSGAGLQVLCASDHPASLTPYSFTVCYFCRFSDSLMSLGLIVGLQQTAWTECYSILWRLLGTLKPVANSNSRK